ncbi:MAG TPA: formate dehydrogenase subunit gamma [Xanthobacteraceae bacterium]|jgi:formate dehydrogenase subunit gamma
MRALLKTSPKTCRAALAIVALFGLVVLAHPASAQQPSAQQPSVQQPKLVDPDASSVKEDQLLQQMRIIRGRGTIPDTKSYNLEQPAGREWRQFREVILPWFGAIAIVGMLVLLVLFYLIRGMVRLEAGRSGRTIVRFNAFERFVHWMTASCFVIQALTGLNITFGRKLLLPLIGPQAFTDWSQWGKYAHNFLSFPFTLGVILIFLMWIAWNIPDKSDVEWLKEGGGLVGHKHVPAGHFNAGQKMIYWFVVLVGGLIAASGYVMMFPFYLTDIAGMQLTQMVHGVAALLFVAVMLSHIYIGTIGMEGAFDAMGTGEVDLNWAKQHHSLWVEEEVAKGRVAPPPRDAAATPAE